jgi:predicted phosphodiesterase
VRVAALYDLHGNLPALAAVLADVAAEEPDAIVLGGDLASGPMPYETLARVRTLGPRARSLRGNGDRELVALYDGTAADGGETDVWGLRDRWAARQLTRAQRDFLAALPGTLALDVTGLGPTLFCHGSPRRDDEIITRATPEGRLRELLGGIAERVVVCGHTHVQFDRTVDGVRIVNPGSVGMPYEREPGAYWALLGPDVSLRRTSYDVAAAAAQFRGSAFPAADAFVGETFLAGPGPEEATAVLERLARG